MSDHSASCVVATSILALGLLMLTVWPTNSLYHGAAAITDTVGLLRFAFGLWGTGLAHVLNVHRWGYKGVSSSFAGAVVCSCGFATGCDHPNDDRAPFVGLRPGFFMSYLVAISV